MAGVSPGYPTTTLIDEVQFRRGEMLFLRRDYNAAELAYAEVVRSEEESRFYEQSLYKLGWSQFKLAWHEDSLQPFFTLLDRAEIESLEAKGAVFVEELNEVRVRVTPMPMASTMMPTLANQLWPTSNSKRATTGWRALAGRTGNSSRTHFAC